MRKLCRSLTVCQSVGAALALATSLPGCDDYSTTGFPTPDLSSSSSGFDLATQADLSLSPALTITAVSPATVPNSGGTQLTITGTGFVTGTTVMVGGVDCAGVTVISANSITCTAPAKAATCGAVPIVVTNPDTQSAGSQLAYAPSALTLAAGSNVPNGAGSRSAVAADFNGDGKNDIANLSAALLGVSSVSVQLGNGNGTFAAKKSTSLALGQDPAAMAVGDMDNNGAPDVVLILNAGGSSPQVLVMLGQKDGTFKAHASGPIALTRSSAPTAVAIATADSKASPYVVVSGTTAMKATIDVLQNDGKGGLGSLAQTVVAAAQSSASHITLSDINNDGKLDALTANSIGNSVSVLTGNGAGKFTAVAGSPFAMGAAPNHVIAVDLDNDGKLDLVSANTGTAAANTGINIRKGDGAGGFGAAPSFTLLAAAPTNIASADLNGNYGLDHIGPSAPTCRGQGRQGRQAFRGKKINRERREA